ncbi:MAG: radical SAM protein [Bacteroidetes bacterium]|nr:MAG: radical SAM protein [Bacteroidota bacterium]
MEHFYTLQGEGFHTGRAAYFIRLAGCDVGCVWCDVKESWDAGAHEIVSINSLLQAVRDSGSDFVVITGGEPCMYDLTVLCEQLKEQGCEVALETSGCYALKGELDWYCFSPKKFKDPLPEAYEHANELKVVVFHPSDLKWAEDHAKKLNPKALCFLQPEWSKAERILPLLIDYVKEHPRWKLSLQTHKYLNIP